MIKKLCSIFVENNDGKRALHPSNIYNMMETTVKQICANCIVIDNTRVVSYETHVADIDHENRTVTARGYWSRTTSRHISKTADAYGYELKK